MDPTLIVGIIILAGFIFGEAARRVRLPKITGYILAGVCLNPELFGIIPENFTEHTILVTNIALSFITFSVGGTLLCSRVRALGRAIVSITFFEAEFALLAVILGFIGTSALFGLHIAGVAAGSFITLCIFLGCLASPTDPSATLAVAHEYQASGQVSSTIMGVAAFDDVLGIVNYSLGAAAADFIVLHKPFGIYASLLRPAITILGGIAIGLLSGLVFNFLTRLLRKETEGTLIVLVLAMLTLCFGVANLLRFDELLATMAMGFFVVNYNPKNEAIFQILERYTEEIIFVFFFTLSGMHLHFLAVSRAFGFVILFVIFRAVGKGAGTLLGASISGAPRLVKRYTALGLIPQGGIVIGLALLIKQNQAFESIADTLLGIIIGATVIHELVGPIVAKLALQKAGEIEQDEALKVG